MVGFFCESAGEETNGVFDYLKTERKTNQQDFSWLHYPFVDFDCIKFSAKEMDTLDSTECYIAEIGSNLGDNGCLVNPIDKLSAQDVNEKENSGSVKVECCETDELVIEHRDGPVGAVKSNGLEDSSMLSFVKADLGSAETKDDLHQSVITSSDKVQDGCGGGIFDEKSCGKLGSLSCSIEKGLEKVSLVGGKDGLVTDESDMKLNSNIVGNCPESSSESESESESETSSSAAESSSSSSSSASSDSSESDDDKDEIVEGDVDGGQLMDTDVQKMVSGTGSKSDDDDDDNEEDQDDIAAKYCHDLELGNDIDDDGDIDLPKEPIRSKNELQVLPPVPPVTVSLQPGHQIMPVGVVLSVLGTQVIVEGSEKHNPLSEGSILWIASRRLPLGIIDEIFGPVKTPYYIIRYNSESEVPSDIQNGLTIGFVPEFVDHVLNDKNLYKKGYDASGENDEEICDETEFSDDEKEAEYKKMLKTMSKRDKSDNNNESERPGNKKKNRQNFKSRENSLTNSNQPSTSQPPTIRQPQPNQLQQQLRPPSPFFSQGNQSTRPTFVPGFSGGPCAQSLGHGNQQSSSPMGPVFLGGSNASTQMPLPAQLLLNSNWGNGMPSHHPNMAMALSNGFQPNGMPWLQQNQQMFLTGNPGQFQQQFDLSQLVTGSNGTSFGPMNFNAGAPNSPWPGMMGSNLSFQAPFMAGAPNFNAGGPNVQLPMFSGFLPNGPQQPERLSCNISPATSFPGNEEVSSQTRQGVSSGRGRGRGRTSFQHRGGRFGGGRGRS